MAAFKAYVIWFSSERLPTINGLQMVAGGLGALGATIPLQNALSFTDWRGVFTVLAVITVFASVCVWVFLPENKITDEKLPSLKLQLKEMWQVFRSKIFWGIAPLAAISQGSNMAIQGLWMKPWLRDVAGISGDAAAQLLFAMILAFIAGFLTLGIIAERLSQIFDVRPIPIGVLGMSLFLFSRERWPMDGTAALFFWLFCWDFLDQQAFLSMPDMRKYFPNIFPDELVLS